MLDSLLKQDLPQDEFEIIVVDDGSKEDPIVLKNYVQRYSNIQYVRQKNAGPGAARNKGVTIAKGEFVFFCDSDDYIANNVLGGLYDIAHERNYDMLFHNVIEVSEKDIDMNLTAFFGNIMDFETGKDFFSIPFVGRIRTGPNQYIINRDFIFRAKLKFPDNMIMNEDSSFLIDAVLAAGKVGKVNVDAYFYVQNPQSLIHWAGKIKQAERFSDNMLCFIHKLTDILENNEIMKDMPRGCTENIENLRNQKAFVMLVTACQNLPTASFDKKVVELRKLGAYPKPFYPHWILKYLYLRISVIKLLNEWYVLKNKINTK